MRIEFNLSSAGNWLFGISSFEGGEIYEDDTIQEYYVLQIGLLLFSIDITIFK